MIRPQRPLQNRIEPAFLVLAAVALVLAFAGCGSDNRSAELESAEKARSAETPAAAQAETGSRLAAPDFQLKNLEGDVVRLSDYRGKVVILDFWATWCPPCKAEIPHFVELQREYGSRGLEVVGISLDQQGVQVVRPFARNYQINYTMLVDGQTAARDYGGIEGIPTTFIIDKQGRIVQKLVGYNSKSTFESAAKQLLAENEES